MSYKGILCIFARVVVILCIVYVGLLVYEETRGAILADITGISSEQVKVYTFGDGIWRLNATVCHPDTQEKIKVKNFFKKSFIKSDFGITILYINDPEEDFLSREIHRKNTWEPWVFNTIYKFIKHDSSIGIIDIGANIGAYSLQLANIGRRVISVEAAYQNVRHLCASTTENCIQDKVTIVHNAISNDNVDVPFVFPSGGEFALGFVDQIRTKETFFKWYGSDSFRNDTILIRSVALNDFLTLPEFLLMSKVFIKMDVPGVEHMVIEGCDEIINTGKVVGFHMGWALHRGKKSGDYIIRKMSNWSFEPYYCNDILKDRSPDFSKPCKKLETRSSEFWGNGIVWLPQTKSMAWD